MCKDIFTNFNKNIITKINNKLLVYDILIKENTIYKNIYVYNTNNNIYYNIDYFLKDKDIKIYPIITYVNNKIIILGGLNKNNENDNNIIIFNSRYKYKCINIDNYINTINSSVVNINNIILIAGGYIKENNKYVPTDLIQILKVSNKNISLLSNKNRLPAKFSNFILLKINKNKLLLIGKVNKNSNKSEDKIYIGTLAYYKDEIFIIWKLCNINFPDKLTNYVAVNNKHNIYIAGIETSKNDDIITHKFVIYKGKYSKNNIIWTKYKNIDFNIVDYNIELVKNKLLVFGRKDIDSKYELIKILESLES